MLKLPFSSDFLKNFRRARQPRPRQASIYRWLTLGMTLVVILTVFFVGLPAIGIIWRQLDDQVQLRVLNAQSSTQALYTAEQKNFLQQTQLASERPTLCALLRRRDIPNLISYLEVLRQNTFADSLVVVTTDGQRIVSGSDELLPPEAFLDSPQLPFADFIALENPVRLAIIAVSEIASTEGCEKGLTGQVIAIQVLDHDFMRQLAKNTGLEQSLIISDHRVATSLINVPDWPLNPDAALQVLRTQEACCVMGASDDETYYVGLSPLLDHQGRVIALSEVALPADTIRNGAWNTIGLLFGLGILVAFAGTGLALLLTRRITRPLHALSDAAERISTGD